MHFCPAWAQNEQLCYKHTLHVNPGNLGMTEKLTGKIQQNLFMVD